MENLKFGKTKSGKSQGISDAKIPMNPVSKKCCINPEGMYQQQSFSNSLSSAGSYKNPKLKINLDHIIMLWCFLLVHFSAFSGSRTLHRHGKRILLGISQKNDRFRRSQNLLPQKLEGFADFADIQNTFRNNKGVFFWYIFLPLLVLGDFADIENVFLWASLSKMTDLEGFKAFCLKSWRVSQSSQGFQIL